MKRWWHILLGLVVIAAILFAIYWIVSGIWEQLTSLDSKVSATLLTAAATVIAATIAVVLGKYFERKIDIEAHHRTKKIEIYDEFLSELFKLIASSKNGNFDDPSIKESLAKFISEWQRKMILWGGQNVLVAYASWISHAKKNIPDIQSLLLVDKFFREIRRDLGHKSNKLEEGALISLILKDPDEFMQKAKEDPSMTFEGSSGDETD